MGQTMNNKPDGYPITANRALVDPQQIKAFCDMCFDYFDWHPNMLLALRPQGEKGTIQEGKNRNGFIQPKFQDISDHITNAAYGWAEHHFAGFAITASMSHADGKSSSVLSVGVTFTDLDTGDTNAKLDYLVKWLGAPTMIVESGGTTELGTPKYHVWWKHTEPSDNPILCAEIRKLIAEKVGGDALVGRPHQPMRIPGTAYMKNGVALQCKVQQYNKIVEIDFDDFAHKVQEMPQMPGVEAIKQKNMMDLSYQPSAVPNALINQVREGGETEETNRWSSFSAVAGHFIYCARKGMMDIADAYSRTQGWVEANMVPKWPEERIQQEFKGLLNADISNNGALPSPTGIESPKTDSKDKHNVSLVSSQVKTPNESLMDWATHNWASNDKPQRKWLVHGLIQAAKPHLLVAAGGVGKSFLCLDLALKIAAGDGAWMGQPVRKENSGTVVVITAEDDKDELHIRLCDIDPDGTRFTSGDKLIVLPLVDSGGTFPLVANGKEQTGPSKQWQTLLGALKEITDLKLVIIDTLNATMHGEENSATVIQEYFREAGKICGDLGSALLVTHHIRKSEHAIETLEEMSSAVRGSSALPAAVRMVIGVWEAPDWNRRLEAMHMKPVKNTMFLAGVCKANNPEALSGVKSLVRAESGNLIDCTESDPFRDGRKFGDESQAWLVFAIKSASEAGFPLRRSGAEGLYSRRHELPGHLKLMKQKEFTKFVQVIMDDKRVELARYTAAGIKVLDVMNGPISKQLHESQLPGSWDTPDWEAFHFDNITKTIRPNK
tara:strand:- start:506 stop:2839 length:2334 start_codon:yes stop_codon:yes gene_type:complete